MRVGVLRVGVMRIGVKLFLHLARPAVRWSRITRPSGTEIIFKSSTGNKLPVYFPRSLRDKRPKSDTPILPVQKADKLEAYPTVKSDPARPYLRNTPTRIRRHAIRHSDTQYADTQYADTHCTPTRAPRPAPPAASRVPEPFSRMERSGSRNVGRRTPGNRRPQSPLRPDPLPGRGQRCNPLRP